MPSPSILAGLGQLSIALAILLVVYYILKLIVPTIGKREGPRHSAATDIAVLQTKVGYLESTVMPLAQVVGDVKVLLDAIEDLRGRVETLERHRRNGGMA